ncbi:MAG TPA: hypothetical protein VGX51_10855, partial [Solirubrobacteraceae bacterium]|nr:hypothetical protein [Solirubrobacteraceae bacterium]
MRTTPEILVGLPGLTSPGSAWVVIVTGAAERGGAAVVYATPARAGAAPTAVNAQDTAPSEAAW